MTTYRGHWEQLEPNPKYPEQEPTAYIRASAGTQEEIRDRLDTWCDYIISAVNEFAEQIKDQDKCSIAIGRTVAWQEIDAMLQEQSDGKPIGVDPQVYTTKKLVEVCKKELVATQKNGKLKDIKKSLVDRHNWQVVHWAYTKFKINSSNDIEPKHLDWIEERVVDVQTTVVEAPSRSSLAIASIFGK